MPTKPLIRIQFPSKKIVRRNVRSRDRGQQPQRLGRRCRLVFTIGDEGASKSGRRGRRRFRGARPRHIRWGRAPCARLVRSCRWLEGCGLVANHEIRGQRPQLQKIQIRNDDTGGQAATVAGYAGPGLHTWPTGHILQDTDTGPLRRTPTPPSAVIPFSSLLASSFSSQVAVFCFLLSTFRLLLPSPRLRPPARRIFL